MIIKHGNIVKATESELRDYWLARYDEVMTFDDFKKAVQAAGTLIVPDSEAGVETVRRCRSCRWSRLCSQSIEYNGTRRHIESCSLHEEVKRDEDKKETGRAVSSVR